MTASAAGDHSVQRVLDALRPPPELDEHRLRQAATEVLDALRRFTALLPIEERPAAPHELLEHVAGGNAFDVERLDRNLPVTLVLRSGVHPSYFSGAGRIGSAPWRLVHTDGGDLDESPQRERLLDEATRLAEAMHDKNPFGEVAFDGGKTVFVQGGGAFQAVTVLYGDPHVPKFILAKGGLRYYETAPTDRRQKERALRSWAASSVLAGVLAKRYVAGPDMRMGEEEMGWIEDAASGIGRVLGLRQLPAVTGLPAARGGLPHAAWEVTGRTVAASLREALLHRAMEPYGLSADRPLSVLVQGFGDVGGSLVRLLTEDSPGFEFVVSGIADEFGAVYHEPGLDVPSLLALRAESRPTTEYAGPLTALWAARPDDPARERPEFRGSDGIELLRERADVFIPAAIPNVIDAELARDLQVRVVAEGANNAVVPGVASVLHERRILYLPGEAINWGGVKASTLETLLRQLTMRRVPLDAILPELQRVLEDHASEVDVSWALELLRSGLAGPPLDLEETRAYATSLLDDLARSNTRWLMDLLADEDHRRSPIELVRGLSGAVRALKVRLLSLLEEGLGDEFHAPRTSLRRLERLLSDKLKELHSDTSRNLTAAQVVEQRQMLQQLQRDVPSGLSPTFASLLAALDLARQKVMDPSGYSQAALRHDLEVLRAPLAEPLVLEESLHRLQRVHPGPDRAEFAEALAALVKDAERPAAVRRNAAHALAKIGSSSPRHARTLVAACGDPDASVRAACRRALGQLAMDPAEP